MRDARGHIIAVAIKLFLQKNYKEVTMKEIVKKTGLSKGAFYHYFDSKESLFREILDYFSSTFMDIDYERYPQDSLRQFYNHCANEKDTARITSPEETAADKGSYFNMNFFFLIFDGLKLFPGFREKLENFQNKELRVWTEVINRARERGEIKSPLNDKLIAMIFIHTGDGIALNLILGGEVRNLKKEIKPVWDKFYESLKA